MVVELDHLYAVDQSISCNAMIVPHNVGVVRHPRGGIPMAISGGGDHQKANSSSKEAVVHMQDRSMV